MEKNYNELEELVNEGVKINAYPGACYAVVKKDHFITGCVGNQELYPKAIPNDDNNLYDLASLTKVISTTTAILLLMERGKIRFNDTVGYFLPKFKFPNITIYNLVTHTSGIQEGIYGPKDTLSKEDVWDKIYSIDSLLFEPGTKISYSDINYILLGHIIEIISGEKLEDFTRKNIFEPLMMYDTGYLPKDKKRCCATEYRDDKTMKGYVKGDVHDETAYAMGGVAGHAGLFSTVSDLSHFVQMILNDGMYGGNKFLSKATIDLLYNTEVKMNDGLFDNYLCRTIGWQKKELNSSAGDLISKNTILHTGFTGNNLFIDRDNEIGFILLTNRVHPTRKNILHMRQRALIGNYVIAHKEEF